MRLSSFCAWWICPSSDHAESCPAGQQPPSPAFVEMCSRSILTSQNGSCRFNSLGAQLSETGSQPRLDSGVNSLANKHVSMLAGACLRASGCPMPLAVHKIASEASIAIEPSENTKLSPGFL